MRVFNGRIYNYKIYVIYSIPQNFDAESTFKQTCNPYVLHRIVLNKINLLVKIYYT